MGSEKAKSKAMKIAVAMEGVSSVSLGKDNDQLEVIGEGVDSVCLAKSLRKKFCFADIVSVDEVKPPKPEPDPPPCPPPCPPPPCMAIWQEFPVYDTGPPAAKYIFRPCGVSGITQPSTSLRTSQSLPTVRRVSSTLKLASTTPERIPARHRVPLRSPIQNAHVRRGSRRARLSVFSGRPRLASLPPASRPQSRNLPTHPSMARGILAPPRHYGAPHAPVSCPMLTRRILGPCLRHGRLLCLGRVGPHLKSVAHPICRHLAMIPHGMLGMPTCPSTRLHNFPAMRRRPDRTS
ncbi:Heavy metal-associated isoprenylated plant protein 47 [Sesamum angolense]|uniref:Heavy metal-associated isoprenylated plant protein 47 n=1 Tax=Sesamum angolense TaxID=2727404 RepID=A0AAE1WSF5_9LAMI|nr:Heavy metal-associated isoprenylated plant protein 47 [Sesamum angolense]